MTQDPSIAAISPQWIGIAVASAIVVVLIVILLVRRGKAGKAVASTGGRAAMVAPTSLAQPGAPAAPQTTPGAPPAFLDQPLEKGFDGLGKPVAAGPALGTVVMPREKPSGPPAGASPDPLAPQPIPPSIAPMDMGMDMGSLAPETPEGGGTSPFTGEPPQVSEGGDALAEPASPEAAAQAPLDAGDAAPAAALSDIIVTTNKAEVDLTDPDVRAMLEELVRDEIALAEVYRQQGQTLDAILQLTEAEKACTALGDAEQSQRIKALMRELQT